MSKTKRNLSKILQNLHIYGGLFCAVYLMVVGVSALNFQHRFLPEQPVDTVSYNRTVHFDSTLKIDTLSKFVRQELGIKGYLPKWEFRDNKQGALRFKIERPGRTYEVKLNRNSTLIRIDEIHYSPGKILRALHFGSTSGQLKDPLLDIWSLYGQLSGLFAFIAVASGIWLWFNRAVKTRRQWIIIACSGIASLTYIGYIWLIG